MNNWPNKYPQCFTVKIRLAILGLIILSACVGYKSTSRGSLINLTHLDHLYREINIKNAKVGIIGIYADYPSYDPVGAVGEGIACVDDVSRAAVFLFRYYARTSQKTYLHKAKRLLHFILELQDETGFFYNFIKADATVNKLRTNSQAKADWWTWRAMWALAEGMVYAKKYEPSYYNKLNIAFLRTLNALKNSDGTFVPAKIPSDQASVFLMALTTYYRVSSNKDVIRYIPMIADKIMNSQKGNEKKFPYYAFLSWENEWHAWGNSQSYALLKAGQILNEPRMIKAAANEIEFFYPYLLSQGYLKQFKLGKKGNATHTEHFEQIAYAIRPMVWASLELYNITGDTTYARQAGKLAAWFAGENNASALMYDPRTGRCYDGIDSTDKINLNSGAESTIEALLTVLEVEKNAISRNYLQSAYRKKINE